jgi:hypothetical protein
MILLRTLTRAAAPMALAVGALGVLSTTAWASPASTPAAAPTFVALTALPTQGNEDPDRHGSREDCQQHGGHEWWDASRGHWYCRGGSHDGWWW